MDHRRLGTAATAALSLLLLSACGADADAYPHGEEAASWTDGSVVRVVLLYVVVPLLVMLSVAALAWLPGMVRSKRYRPREGWHADPVWFAGPSDPVGAVETATTGDVTRGGAGGSW